jgi:hypothetical protein
MHGGHTAGIRAIKKEMTRGLGEPRVKHDWRVREAEGGFCAPVRRKTQARMIGSAPIEKSIGVLVSKP